MKQKFYFFIAVLFLFSCKVSENTTIKKEKIYIEKIEYKDNFFIIDARDSNSKYRIISYNDHANNSNKIQIGKYYQMDLEPINYNSDKLAINYLHIVRCIKFFSQTEVCTEMNRELYVTDNLDGLRYFKKSNDEYSRHVLKRISYI